MKRFRFLKYVVLISLLTTSLCWGAAGDYKVKSDGTIYGYDFITKGPWIDVRAYLPAGFVTDGSVDYSTQIQTAINAATGKPFYLPYGTYLTSKITLPSGITIDGVGTLKLKAGANTSIFEASNKSNITIRNIKFDGNKVNQTGGTPRFVDIINCTKVLLENLYGESGYEAGFVAGNGGSEVRFNGLTAKNCNGVGIIAGVPNMVVENSYTYNTAHGIQVPASATPKATGVQIRNNTIDSPVAPYQGIIIEEDCDYALVIGNKIIGITTTTEGLSSDRADHCQFIGNHLTGPFSLASINMSQVNKCSIIGNHVSGNTTGVGIRLEGNCNDNLVEGNRVDNTVGGIYLTQEVAGANNRNSIVGNQISNITGATSDSIRTIDGDDMLISNNMIYTIGRHGIVSSPSISGVRHVIVGNKINSVTGTGITITGGDHHNISGNTVNGAFVDGIRFIGVGSTVTNNVLSNNGNAGAGADIYMVDASPANQLISGNTCSSVINYQIIAAGAAAATVSIHGNIFIGAVLDPLHANAATGTIRNNIGKADSYYADVQSYIILTVNSVAPSVQGGRFFQTNNTVATKTASLINGYVGQEVWVIVQDANTTFDFSTGGENGLLGNARVDRVMANGDSIKCIFDGVHWSCIVVDVTI